VLEELGDDVGGEPLGIFHNKSESIMAPVRYKYSRGRRKKSKETNIRDQQVSLT
jgi:hypothetical protein